jgi:hypothetical protein
MEKVKKSRVAATVVMTFFVTAPIQSIARDLKTGLKIEIHVYNYSAVSAETLSRAELENVRIFEQIGIAIIWLVCPLITSQEVRDEGCALPDAPTKLTVRLFSNSVANRGRLGPDVFGYALLPGDEGFGLAANVYADRIQKPPDEGECAEVILGRVIAHELGHLLLGKHAHSTAGIMHTPWRIEDLELHRGGMMLFLAGEGKKIRAQVLARMSSASTR